MVVDGQWVSIGSANLDNRSFALNNELNLAFLDKGLAARLTEIEQELRKDVGLSRAADLAEQAARIMLADLDEWRLVNQQRDLSVG